MNYLDFQSRFPDEESCMKFLFDAKERPKCNTCTGKLYRRKDRASYICSCGWTEVYPKVGTIFSKSRIPLMKWFYIIFLFCNSKNGLSAKEIERQAGVTYASAYRMGEKIRGIMKENFLQEGVIEADEMGWGGRRRRINGKNGRFTKPFDVVMGTVERGGKLRMTVAESWDTKGMKPHFNRVKFGSTLYTDGHPAYREISFSRDFLHKYISHSEREWARGDVTTNHIEAHWSHLKKTIRGTYNNVSKEKLPMYLAEREFSYNHRNDDRFKILMSRVVVK